ncbi:hypothetical protein PVT67_11685 [Gallaecimonas kandeliae]|uniref:hypothetical protein n=1 Tax=Gallaecimonas kandeliae TaxID=3029055 RepID=UPI0026475DF7|nr:hypothetical protein [Gallaecimonas kandeliae]WKE64341.1 hypothetical protein PVT67_11685 [Gallaecimonas kandeliae]
MSDMEQPQLDQANDTNKVKPISRWYFIVPVVAALLLLGAYLLKFHGALSPKHEDFGTFGDYLGGVLNPILSFVAIVLLVNQLRMQAEELQLAREDAKLTRQEMADARVEAAKAAVAQQDMVLAAHREQKLSEIGLFLTDLLANLTTLESQSRTQIETEYVERAADTLAEIVEWVYAYQSEGGSIRYCAKVIDSSIRSYHQIWNTYLKHRTGFDSLHSRMVECRRLPDLTSVQLAKATVEVYSKRENLRMRREYQSKDGKMTTLTDLIGTPVDALLELALNKGLERTSDCFKWLEKSLIKTSEIHP